MELTTTQKSAFISEMLSSEAGINELIRVLLDTFSKQERALFVEEHEGEQCNGFRPRVLSEKGRTNLTHFFGQYLRRCLRINKPHIRRIGLAGRPLFWQHKGLKAVSNLAQSIFSANL